MALGYGIGSFIYTTSPDGEKENSFNFYGPNLQITAMTRMARAETSELLKAPDGIMGFALEAAGADLLLEVNSQNASPEENLANLATALVMLDMANRVKSGDLQVGLSNLNKGTIASGRNQNGETNLREMGYSVILSTNRESISIQLSENRKLIFNASAIYTSEKCISNCE